MRTGIRRHLLICKLAAMLVAAVLTTVNYAHAKEDTCDGENTFTFVGPSFPPLPVGTPAVATDKVCFDQATTLSSDLSALGIPPPAMTEVKAPKFSNPVPGDVLIVGGMSTKTTAVEFFDSTTRKFAKTGIASGPAGFTPIELDGSVLIAAGFGLGAPVAGLLPAKSIKRYLAAAPSTVAQLYDYVTGTVAAATGSLNVERSFYTATTIAGCSCNSDGKVLITGGFNLSGQPLRSAELYDPSSQTFMLLANSMTDSRAMHTATLLNDGTVLIVGGIDRIAGIFTVNQQHFQVDAVATNSAEIFNPSAGTFTAIPAPNLMALGAAGHTATLLDDGKVLIAGGFYISPSQLLGISLTQAEIYDPMTQTFTATGSLTDDRVLHTATLMPNGTVLVTGGFTVGLSWPVNLTNGSSNIVLESGSGARNTAEIYDPNAGAFACVKGTKKVNNAPACDPAMAQARGGQSATLMTDGPLAGQVLIAGGFGKAIQASAELYNPAPTKSSANGSFKATGAMSTPHALHGALLLH
jgi:hypothetical protein